MRWNDADLRAYRRSVRLDPCAYCGGEGGTIDHIIPKALGGAKWWWGNMTGACERCNRLKDQGRNGGHKPVLQFMLSRLDEYHRQSRISLLAVLRPGMRVQAPWGSVGTIMLSGAQGTFVRLDDQDHRVWLCANPLALRDESGRRLADCLRLGLSLPPASDADVRVRGADRRLCA